VYSPHWLLPFIFLQHNLVSCINHPYASQ
jgi:hypothetical protein